MRESLFQKKKTYNQKYVCVQEENCYAGFYTMFSFPAMYGAYNAL